MKDRKGRRDRIMDVAVDLAMEGGFDNVRQREVAAAAGVALGTLYKSFRSKEDILVAAVQRQAEGMEAKLKAKPVSGADPLDRIANFFEMVTRGMVRKPNYARSVIRAMASGEPEVAANVASYRDHVTRMSVASMRGVGSIDPDCGDNEPSEQELQFAGFMQDIWFSSLVGWSAGFIKPAQVSQHMREAAKSLATGIPVGK